MPRKKIERIEHPAAAGPSYFPAELADLMGMTYLKGLSALDPGKLEQAFGSAIDPGDGKRFGATWAAKDLYGNRWSIYTRQGDWHLSGRGEHYPSKPTTSATSAFVKHLLTTCKEK